MDSDLLERVSECVKSSAITPLAVDTSSFQFLDPLLVLLPFTRCMCLLFVLEVVRRLVQSWRNAFDDLRLVTASVAAFIVLLFVKENTYSIPVLFVVITAYVAFMASPWGPVRKSC